MKVFMHVGFHKTGTTTVQEVLGQNRRALEGLGTTLRAGWRDLGDFGRIGRRCTASRLTSKPMRRYGIAARQFAASLPQAPLILISQETILGRMPGSFDEYGNFINDYTSLAIPLLQRVERAFRKKIPGEVDLTFLFSLRDRDSFIRSSYKHQLRNRRVVESLETFSGRFAPDFSLESEVTKIAAGLRTAKCDFWRLEDARQHRLGPAEELLQKVGLTDAQRATFLPAAMTRRKGQPDEIDQQILALNRSNDDPREVEQERRRILDEAGIPPD